MGFSSQLSWGQWGWGGSREEGWISPNSLRTSRPAPTTFCGPKGGWSGRLQLGPGELQTCHGD